MGSELLGEGWRSTVVIDGIRKVECDSWQGYINLLNGAMLDFRNYVFRGHAVNKWTLKSTLDRTLPDAATAKQVAKARAAHLQSFKYAARGRRGPAPTALQHENDWWALGQHHGLATPLLDWSESPYVAAYFAFCDADEEHEASDTRVVFALQRGTIERKCREMARSAEAGGKREAPLTFIRPMSDDNQRLITQRGLFTRAPDNFTVEEWVTKVFKGSSDGAKLLRIDIPSAQRPTAMKSLNRMNINHLSLFPDLYGAAKYCNFELAIERY